MTLPPTKNPLSEDQMIAAMTDIMDGRCNNEAIESFLRGLSKRGETVEEITGAARVMREKASTIKAPYASVDCCGTGGDASGTYNVSTAVAIVAAASRSQNMETAHPARNQARPTSSKPWVLTSIFPTKNLKRL